MQSIVLNGQQYSVQKIECYGPSGKILGGVKKEDVDSKLQSVRLKGRTRKIQDFIIIENPSTGTANIDLFLY